MSAVTLVHPLTACLGSAMLPSCRYYYLSDTAQSCGFIGSRFHPYLMRQALTIATPPTHNKITKGMTMANSRLLPFHAVYQGLPLYTQELPTGPCETQLPYRYRMKPPWVWFGCPPPSPRLVCPRRKVEQPKTALCSRPIRRIGHHHHQPMKGPTTSQWQNRPASRGR